MQNKRFNVLIGVIAFGIFSMYLAQPLTPNFLTGVHGLSLSQVGLIFTTGAVGNSLMTIVFSRVQPRRGFILSQGLVILFALIVWQATSLPVFALGYFLLGGFRLGRPMAMAQAKSSSAVLRACNVIDRNNSSAPAVVCRRPDKEVKQAFAFIRGSSLRLLIAALRMKSQPNQKRTLRRRHSYTVPENQSIPASFPYVLSADHSGFPVSLLQVDGRGEAP